jgi:hypothetical protein
METGRYGNHGTVISLRPRSTAFTIALAMSSASSTKRRMRALRRFVRGVKPSVSTKPGTSVCTRIPSGRRVAESEREKASCACFAAAYGPAGANAMVPATETTFTTCARPAAALMPGRNARVHQTPPR